MKDLRLMIEQIHKDYQRLADDMAVLSECLRPVQAALMLREGQENNAMESK